MFLSLAAFRINCCTKTYWNGYSCQSLTLSVPCHFVSKSSIFLIFIQKSDFISEQLPRKFVIIKNEIKR